MNATVPDPAALADLLAASRRLRDLWRPVPGSDRDDVDYVVPGLALVLADVSAAVTALYGEEVSW